MSAYDSLRIVFPSALTDRVARASRYTAPDATRLTGNLFLPLRVAQLISFKRYRAHHPLKNIFCLADNTLT